MEINKLFSEKIANIHRSLMSCYEDTKRYSPTITGQEREIFNKELFVKILPSIYRVSSGSIIDHKGKSTGQIDAVIELPFSLSFPISSGENRLLLADTVGAAFEIKSDLNSQWDDAINKIMEIKDLHRKKSKTNEIEFSDNLFIPSFIIGFKGPKSLETLYKKMNEIPIIKRPDGILIIDSGIFYGRVAGSSSIYESSDASGAILAFISVLYQTLQAYNSKIIDLDSYLDIL